MAITALPTPPSSSSPSNFDTRADAFLGALPTFVTEANALQTDVNTKQGTASTAATTATTQAATATAQAVLAAASAAAAAASASATLWVSGTSYTAGAVVYSPTNYATYRTTTSGTSSTDPAADTTGRWVSAMLPTAEAIGLPSVRPSLWLNFLAGSDMDPRVRTTRSTTKTRVAPNGVTETLLAHQARVDYNPYTKAPRGVRIESARSNLVSAPRDMTAWANMDGGTTVNSNSATASDGTVTADEVVAASGTRGARGLDITCTAAVHAIKVRVMAGTTTGATLALFLSSTRLAGAARVLDGPGSVAVSGANEVAITGLSATQYTTVEFVTASATSSGTHTIFIYPGALTQSAGDSIFVDWAQAEAGGASSSDIPLGVSRAADVLVVSGADFSAAWAAGVGTLVVGVSLCAAGAAASARVLAEVSNASANERVTLYVSSADSVVCLIYDGGAEQASMGVARPSASFVAATAVAASGPSLAATGATLQTGSAGTMPSPTQLSIGCDNSSSYQLDGWVRFVGIFPARLTNAELSAVVNQYA